MFILDSIGFGSAFALLIPLSYTPDVAFEISGAWFAAPSVIIMFYFLNIFGQFISSSNRKKEEDFSSNRRESFLLYIYKVAGIFYL